MLCQMRILFLDESGTPPSPGRAQHRYFAIGGVSIPDIEWTGLRDAVMGMKIRRGIRGELKWRYFSPHNEDPRNPMRSMSADQRNEVRSEIYQILRERPSIKSIVCVTSIVAAFKMPSIPDRDALYHGTYKPVSERFQYYLQDISREAGIPEFGIIACDHRGAQDDKRLRLHHQKLLHATSAFTSNYKNLIESVFLQPSNLSVGIQLADMVVGAVWRKFEVADTTWYSQVEPTLRRSKDGVIEGYGIVKFPKANWE